MKVTSYFLSVVITSYFSLGLVIILEGVHPKSQGRQASSVEVQVMV